MKLLFRSIRGGGPSRRAAVLASALGAVVLSLVFASSAMAATFTVNDDGDAGDGDPGNGVCDTDAGAADQDGDPCTLRAAIEEGNANGEADTIDFAAGITDIEVADGQLAISSEIDIEGTGQFALIIRTDGDNRVFLVSPTGDASIADLTVRDGTAPNGGNIRNRNVLHLQTMRVLDGTTAGDGGGIYNDGADVSEPTPTLTMDEATVDGNSAGDEGGGIYNGSGNVLFGAATIDATNSTVSRNGAGTTGGGVHLIDGSSAGFENSTISNNDAPEGGGVYNAGDDASFSSVTLSFNNSPADGANYDGAEDSGTFQNTIVSDPPFGVANCDNEQVSDGNNLSDDTSCGFTMGSDQQGEDPVLRPLANNGGPTQTHLPHQDSPAVDEGSTPLTDDQRGEPRPSGGGDDIGAVELQPGEEGPEPEQPEEPQDPEEPQEPGNGGGGGGGTPGCAGQEATIVGQGNGDNIQGTNGNDVIVGTPGNDVIDGNRGHDLICGRGGNDRLLGSFGQDVIRGNAGNDLVNGNQANDNLRGQRGDDEVRGGKGRDDARGNAGDDLIKGHGNRDVMRGGAGDDIVKGAAGNDRAFGGKGEDTVRGNNGNDALRGNKQDDLVAGGNGNDDIRGGAGRDDCRSGSGNDSQRSCEI